MMKLMLILSLRLLGFVMKRWSEAVLIPVNRILVSLGPRTTRLKGEMNWGIVGALGEAVVSPCGEGL